MKVILQQDVKGQGKKGQMVEVSDGYARYFLLPKKLAVSATAENVNTMKQQEKARKAQELSLIHIWEFHDNGLLRSPAGGREKIIDVSYYTNLKFSTQ